jgi:glycine hydroxymethyltransferase
LSPDPLESARKAELIVGVLRATEPLLTGSGGPSQANYVVAPGLREVVKARAQELLAKYPLYPGINLG